MQKILAVLFSIVFAMLLVLTTLALSLRSFVFDADFYVATLKSQGIFRELEKDPLRFVDLTDQIPQLASIPEQLKQQVAVTILPPDWLEKQAGNAVQAWLAWFAAGEADTPEIPIDLRQIKDRLQGPPGMQVASDIVNAIPTCRPDQQPQLSFIQLPECIPPVFDRRAIVEQVAGALSDTAGRLPVQFDIGPKIAAGMRLGLTFNGRRLDVAMIDAVLLLLALGTIGVWIIGALIGGRTGRERWYWLGGSLLLGSLIVLGLSLFAYVFAPALLPQSAFAGLANEASTAARGIARAFLQQIAVRAMIAGGFTFIVAWVLLGVEVLRGGPQQR